MPTLPPIDRDRFAPAPEDPSDPERTVIADSPVPAAGGPLTDDMTWPNVTDAETTQTPAPADPGQPDTGGRYRLSGEIARGAMGRVYRGRDVGFGREVAVKLLLDDHLAKPEYRKRFAEEARITASLQHPGIPAVYEKGVFPADRPFYAMRLIKGPTLAELLDARPDPRHDRSRLLKVFEKVCEALAYAHEAGVIHRDLKPANVMVGEFGRVTVMDWGVAKVLPYSPLYDPATAADNPDSVTPAAVGEPARTHFGRVLGTPSYMSPEQARGDVHRLDERADVFGLGAILCVILTGTPPFPGSATRAAIHQAARADLAETFARLDASRVDPELLTLCKRCLAPDPIDRPRTAGALYAALTEHLDYDLRRAERDLVRFFDLSPDLFCIAGLDGYFHRVNANFSRVLGYPTADLLSRPFIEFVHPQDVARTRAEMAALSRGQPCVRFRNRYRDVGGGYRWFEWSAKSIPEEGIIFAVARDVTGQVRLEERLRAYEPR